MTSLRIGLAQINPTVGDLTGNRERILSILEESRSRRLDLVAFPELCLTGYPPEDLLLRKDFQTATETALNEIARAAKGISVLVGHPHYDEGGCFNAASMLSEGKVVGRYCKQVLPNFGVFDEKRYFKEGQAPGLFRINGIPLGVLICEDIWHEPPVEALRQAGAAAILVLNASPFHQTKLAERELNVRRRALMAETPILYVNLVGGQDELVFDGGSFALSAAGFRVLQAPEFEESLSVLTLSADKELSVSDDSPPTPGLSEDDRIYRALVLGIRDYARKNQFQGAVLGLSGGIDSALTLALAVDALGAPAVDAVLLPSRYTAEISNLDALEQARRLGSRTHCIPIEAPFESFLKALSPLFAGLKEDLTEENIQARCRGTLLMALSNKYNKLLLTTGNKSEMSVGYATLYGDMAGGFAPLKDIPKMMVYRLAQHRNRQNPVIPDRVLTRPPSAELRPDQKDEDSLPPYPILDAILERYVEKDATLASLIAEGFDAETVRRVIQLVDRSEYKRRQSPPGIKVTVRAFGKDRRYPITNGFLSTNPLSE